jgi:hypothetical protein
MKAFEHKLYERKASPEYLQKTVECINPMTAAQNTEWVNVLDQNER